MDEFDKLPAAEQAKLLEGLRLTVAAVEAWFTARQSLTASTMPSTMPSTSTSTTATGTRSSGRK